MLTDGIDARISYAGSSFWRARLLTALCAARRSPYSHSGGSARCARRRAPSSCWWCSTWCRECRWDSVWVACERRRGAPPPQPRSAPQPCACPGTRQLTPAATSTPPCPTPRRPFLMQARVSYTAIGLFSLAAYPYRSGDRGRGRVPSRRPRGVQAWPASSSS